MKRGNLVKVKATGRSGKVTKLWPEIWVKGNVVALAVLLVKPDGGGKSTLHWAHELENIER